MSVNVILVIAPRFLKSCLAHHPILPKWRVRKRKKSKGFQILGKAWNPLKQHTTQNPGLQGGCQDQGGTRNSLSSHLPKPALHTPCTSQPCPWSSTCPISVTANLGKPMHLNLHGQHSCKQTLIWPKARMPPCPKVPSYSLTAARPWGHCHPGGCLPAPCKR